MNKNVSNMTTYNAALKVNYSTSTADIYLDDAIIGNCRVPTRFNHCFENDYFHEAYSTIDNELIRLTGLTPSQAGTIGAYKLNYSFR